MGEGNYTDDINSQKPATFTVADVTNDVSTSLAGDNFGYDAIGNLIKDTKEGITNIEWTVYGKISKIIKSNDTIYYNYDAAGNRISKTVSTAGVDKTTYYVRDASGNVMSVYTHEFATSNNTTTAPLSQTELHLYGSSRLGVYNVKVDVQNCLNSEAPVTIFTRANKFFQLTNHLGNVLVTISDKKLQHTANNSTVDYYVADVVTANDYYPFGMQMPGRKYSQPNGAYRYGFNGKENDNEIKGEGNQQDYGMRIYDTRLGRFLSVDPITQEYPELTPYQFASNRPIDGIDLDGMEYAPSGYTDPKQMLYQGAADLTQAAGSLYDKMSSVFVSFKIEVENKLFSKTSSVVSSTETTVAGGGNMESWISAGRYSQDNKMPILKLSTIFSIVVKTDTKIELKKTLEKGNVKVESKTALDMSNNEIKMTVKDVRVPGFPVPLHISLSNSRNANGTKTKAEAKSSTTPFNVGGVIEVSKNNNGKVTGAKAGVTIQSKLETKRTTVTNTLTIGVGKTN